MAAGRWSLRLSLCACQIWRRSTAPPPRPPLSGPRRDDPSARVPAAPQPRSISQSAPATGNAKTAAAVPTNEPPAPPGTSSARAETDGVQQLAPGRPTRLQGGDERAASRARTGPRTVHRGRRFGITGGRRWWERRRSQFLTSTARAGGRRHGQAGQHLPQPGHVDAPAVQGVVHGAVPAPVLSHQRQVHRCSHRPIRTQQRIREVEQFVFARGQAVG
jgi:hypothetical protein